MIFLLLLCAAAFTVWLAAAIYRADPRREVNRAGALFGAALCAFLAQEALSSVLASQGIAWWWNRATASAVGLLACATLLRLAVIMVPGAPRLALLPGRLLAGLSLACYLPWYLTGVRAASGPTRVVESFGPLLPVIYASVAGGAAAIGWLLARGARRVRNARERRRLFTVLIGIGVSGVGGLGSACAVYWGASFLQPTVALWALPMMAAVAVAAGGYQAFDLKFAARRVTLGAARLSILGAGVACWMLATTALGRLPWFEAGAVRLLMLVGLIGLDRLLVHWLARHLNRKARAQKRAVADLAVALTSVADREQVKALAARAVAQQFRGACLKLETSKPALAAADCLRAVSGGVDAGRLDQEPELAHHRHALETLMAVLEARAVAGVLWAGRVQGLLAVSAPADLALDRSDLDFLGEVANVVAGPLARAGLMEYVVQLNDELIRVNAELETRVAERTQELTRAHEEVVAAQRDLARQERMAGLGQLAAGVAHEINNPLACVSQNLRTIGEMVAEVGDPRLLEVEEIVCESLASSARIGQIVRDLRRAAAVTETAKVPVQLGELVGRTVESLLAEQPQGPRVELDLAEAPPVLACPEDLGLAVTHLVRNARSSGASRVAIRLRPGEHSVALSVEDNGRGIALEGQRRLFDPFSKIGAVGEGRGLGLAVAAGVVRRHRGTIEVFSQPGQGATFQVNLPATA